MALTIPTNDPSIYDVISSLSTLNQQAIVRPNNPPAGIAGFLFDIPENDEISLTSDITDHFIEDNTAIQDQIALKPEEYTVRGLVAELALFAPPPDSATSPADPLPALADLAPSLTSGAAAIIAADLEAATGETEAITSAQNLYNYYSAQSLKQPTVSKQAKTFLYFYELWKGRQMFTVETPWGTLTDMAILTLKASQDDETRFRSTFTITFKKIRTAGSVSVTVGQLAGRAAAMAAATSENGVAGKKEVLENENPSWYKQLITWL